MSDTPTTVQRPTIIPERPKTPGAMHAAEALAHWLIASR